jgi:hypothetical protein
MLTGWWRRLFQGSTVKRRVGPLKLGPRCKLVLAKLAFDMRESHSSLLTQLPGQRDVLDLGTDREYPAPPLERGR